MTQFYCLFMVVFTVMFPHIANSQEYLNQNVLNKNAVLNSVEKHCQMWYNPLSGNKSPNNLGRNRSLSIIFVRLVNSFVTSVGPEENAESPRKHISTSTKEEKKTVTVEIQCKSPHPVSMRITWGKNHENVDETLDWNRKPMKNSFQNHFVVSTVLQIFPYKTQLPVRVVCMQKPDANVSNRYQSKFEFFLVGRSKLELNPTVENTAYYTMASDLALAACLPMLPWPQDDGSGFDVRIAVVVIGLYLVCVIGSYAWTIYLSIRSNIAGRSNAPMQLPRRSGSLPLLQDVVRVRAPGVAMETSV